MLVRFRAELLAFSTIQTDEIQTHTPAGSDAVRRRLVARIWHLSTMTGFTNCKHKKQNSE